MEDGGRADVIDSDHTGARSTLNRLEMLGSLGRAWVDLRCFRLAQPESDIELKELVADLSVFKPDVVVLDSLDEVMQLFRPTATVRTTLRSE